MSKAYIINFTGFFGHWGMYGTSMAIALALAELGYDSDYLGVNQIADLFGDEKSWEDVKSEATFAAFEARNPEVIRAIVDADIVVVNGEGTLHGLRPSSLRLLALIFYVRNYLNRPVHLINSAIFPSAFDGLGSTEVIAPYVETLGSLGANSIVVRDPASYANAKALGCEAVLGFDCLPLLVRALPIPSRPDGRRRTVVTAAAGCTPSQSRSLAKLIANSVTPSPPRPVTQSRTWSMANILAWFAPAGRPVVYVSGGTAEYMQHERRFHTAMNIDLEGLELAETATFTEFCSLLNSSLLISGRFHYLMAAAWLNAKLAPFESNTRKNTELAAELGLSLPKLYVPSDPLDSGESLRQAIQSANAIDPAAKQKCEGRSLMNFASIPMAGLPVRSSLVDAMATRLGCPIKAIKPILDDQLAIA